MKELAMATLVGGGVCMADATNASIPLTKEWDKTFPKSDKVEHAKATFKNRFGITLAQLERRMEQDVLPLIHQRKVTRLRGRDRERGDGAARREGAQPLFR